MALRYTHTAAHRHSRTYTAHAQPHMHSRTHTATRTQREKLFIRPRRFSARPDSQQENHWEKVFGRFFVLYGIIKCKFMLDRHFYFQLFFSEQHAWCENINQRPVNTVRFSRILTVTWLDFYCVVSFCTIQRSELIGVAPLYKSKLLDCQGRKEPTVTRYRQSQIKTPFSG